MLQVRPFRCKKNEQAAYKNNGTVISNSAESSAGTAAKRSKRIRGNDKKPPGCRNAVIRKWLTGKRLEELQSCTLYDMLSQI